MAGMSGLMRALMEGKGKKAVVEETEEEPVDAGDDMDLHSEGLLSAMKDFLIAVHKSDPEAMAEAFKDAASLCGGGDDDEGDDKAEGEEDGEGPKLDYRR